MTPNAAFLTGSRRYGKPRTGSDIDLVVRMTKTELRIFEDAVAATRLASVGDSDGELDPSYDGVTPFRFGSLNLLVVTDEASYEAWAEATWELVKRKDERGDGVTRAEAVKVHSDYRYQKANPLEPLFTPSPEEVPASRFIPKDGLPF